MSTSSGETSAVAIPFPPRFWWTKRISLTAIILLVLLASLLLLWGWDAHRRLQAEIDRIRASGEPILPEDFAPKAVPDSENYVFYLNQAIAAVNQSVYPPSSSNVDYPSNLPMPDEWFTMAKNAIEANKATLQFLRQARQHEKVDWGVPFKSPVINMKWPSLNSQRNLANLLGDTALYNHLTGNDAEALETLRDLFAQADAVHDEPALIAYLVAGGMDAIGSQRTDLIAPGLRVADDPSPSPTTQPVIPARRAQVQELVALLRRQSDRGMQWAFLSERMIMLDEELWVAKQSWLAPMYELEALSTLKTLNPFIAAATQPALRPTTTAFMPMPATQPGTPLTGAALLKRTMSQLLTAESRSQTRQQLAAITLAARLYQIDHNGQWPSKVDELVPAYLPTLPSVPGLGVPMGAPAPTTTGSTTSPST